MQNVRLDKDKRVSHYYSVFIGLFCCFSGLYGQNTYEVQVRKYISDFSEIAVREMMLYRIPASITLAQGIFESNAGSSRLAREANNHFGIKCHKEWTGKTYIQDDETRNECFRKYENPEESFRDHSFFLSTRDRYKKLFSLDITDYKGWARGLKEAGYATNPVYAEKLINTIETFDLTRYDGADFPSVSDKGTGDSSSIKVVEKKWDVFAEGPGGRLVYLNNGLQFIILAQGDNLRKIADAFGVSERKILKWNDLKKGSPLVKGQMVYLEQKRKNGAASFHIVQQGETMYTISQKYGIQLKHLYQKNRMIPGRPVGAGTKLML